MTLEQDIKDLKAYIRGYQQAVKDIVEVLKE